jgi:arylsulfatase A-like enzyme
MSALLLALLCACSGDPAAPVAPAAPPAAPPVTAPVPDAGPKGPLVLLVSWDTTRADALGCYAEEAHWGLDLPAAMRPAAHTPAADALAARGLRARWALAHAPTTLNSHTSVFSGLDPHGHRVPRNGYPVPPDVPLLGERFAAAGWDTVAVVGASVLERDMGISRGFRVYDDAVGTQIRRRFEDPADRVVDRVLAAVDARPDPTQPLLLFTHFFDAHSPWNTAPESIRQTILDPDYSGVFDGGDGAMEWAIQAARAGSMGTADRIQARGTYLAEVAFADQELGRMLRGLAARGYADDQLVVLFGDHGETLDELPSRPFQHGLDVELVDIHVPLLFAATGRFDVPRGEVLGRPVSLRDVGPTVLGVAGIPGGLGDGVDLRDAWVPPGSVAPPPPPHFAEATKPGSREPADRWNNLGFARAVVHEGAMLRRAEVLHEPPRLHRLAPGQPALDDAPEALRLGAMLDDWDATAPTRRDVSLQPATRAALEALGYLEPGAEASSGN